MKAPLRRGRERGESAAVRRGGNWGKGMGGWGNWGSNHRHGVPARGDDERNARPVHGLMHLGGWRIVIGRVERENCWPTGMQSCRSCRASQTIESTCGPRAHGSRFAHASPGPIARRAQATAVDTGWCIRVGGLSGRLEVALTNRGMPRRDGRGAVSRAAALTDSTGVEW